MHILHMLDILPLIDIAQPPPGAKSYNTPCPCCDHAPRKRHLNINLEKDVFRCPRCGFSGGIFDLYSYYTDVPRRGVRTTLLARLPFPANNFQKQPVARNKVPLCPIEQRSNAYQAPLLHLTLASDHFESLLSRGLSPEEIAELVGCTSSHIGQIENAREIPSMEMTVRIASALCISIDLLVLESLQHPEIVDLPDIEK